MKGWCGIPSIPYRYWWDNAVRYFWRVVPHRTKTDQPDKHYKWCFRCGRRV